MPKTLARKDSGIYGFDEQWFVLIGKGGFWGVLERIVFVDWLTKMIVMTVKSMIVRP